MMELYCTYDKVAQRFEAPAPFISRPVAIRAFKNVIDNESSFTGINYRDFDLMFVGSFDETTGIITACNPQFVCSGLEVRSDDNVPEKDTESSNQ